MGFTTSGIQKFELALKNPKLTPQERKDAEELLGYNKL